MTAQYSEAAYRLPAGRQATPGVSVRQTQPTVHSAKRVPFGEASALASQYPADPTHESSKLLERSDACKVQKQPAQCENVIIATRHLRSSRAV